MVARPARRALGVDPPAALCSLHERRNKLQARRLGDTR
jgi:hypothetical protein